MAFVNMEYGSPSFPITLSIFLDGLANTSSASSALVNNFPDAFMAMDMQFIIVTGSSVSPNGYITVTMERSFGFGSLDTPQRQILALFKLNTPTTTYRFSLDTTKYGSLPHQWAITIRNDTGDSLGFGNSIIYQPKRYVRS